jgi:enoyl-CoA hydratase/carnithine racemase
VHALNMRLRDWPGASMAVFRGQANGAAAGFLANCDVVIGETGSRLGFAEMTYDLPPALVASYLSNKTIPRVAQYMLLTGAQIDIDRALTWGLVHEVHSPEKIIDRAEELIEFLASRAPGAISHCKAALYAFWNQEHEAAGPEGIDMVLEWLCRDADEKP